MADERPTPPPLPWLDDDPAGHPVDPALGGPLRVSPAVPAGEPVIVASDAMLAHAERLARLRDRLTDDAEALGRTGTLDGGLLAGVPAVARDAAHQFGVALALTRGAAHDATRTERMLRASIEAYTAAEEDARRRMAGLAGTVAMMLGPLLRTLVLAGLPVAVGARLAGVPTDEQLRELQDWMLAHPQVITSPQFVEAVRATVMSVDDGTGAALGLPPGVMALIGSALGFDGVEAGAGIVIGAGALAGLFHEGPVAVTRVSTSATTTGPEGAVQRLARVPEGDQVRIERYEAPGQAPRYMVYVGPTETFSPVARSEPWDLTSNVTGVAGLEAGSLRATEAAMRDAGIHPGDAVQFVGFSQGGLVAARLAASGDWNAAGLETYGAPSGNIALPAGLHGMAVRNSDDFIPALAGPQLDHHLLQVERRAFLPDSEMPTELPAPAHQRSAYVAAATEVDQATSTAVREQVAALDAFTADYTSVPGSQVTVMMYHADRVGDADAGNAAASASGASIR
ncbi:MAG TPA: hypothetical protein VL294_05370 [Pseudolysinimonas sp.]|jgi:hypothetical protein|nr:hypothetical protein [Pseudolysinimonas sp.]